MDKPTIGHYASHQRDVTSQEDAALNAALRSSTVKVEHPEIARLRAELAECKRDAERYRYLRNNISFYDVDHDFDVEGRNVPVLASVSECIWYHATDCLLRKLDEVVDAALAAKGE